MVREHPRDGFLDREAGGVEHEGVRGGREGRDRSGRVAAIALADVLEERVQVRDHAPLAIGIDKQLLARQPELEKKTLRIALSMHTGSLRYLKTLEKASHRLDLDGQQTAELTDEHRQHAAEQLRERFRKEAERRKAERAAEAAREAERIQTEKRAAKLNQLVEKFARNK